MASRECTSASNPETVLEDSDKECAICLQPYVHPAQLPCGHIFCFLCIKGIANQSKRCAMCRQEIPRDFLEHPNLLKHHTLESRDMFEGCYQWFYEGRNGWWKYDERTSKELETAYKSGERTVELLIAGFLYIMDFETMLQLRRNDPSRRRRIKRDLATIETKGVAGLRGEEGARNNSNSNSNTNMTANESSDTDGVDSLNIETFTISDDSEGVGDVDDEEFRNDIITLDISDAVI